ncbi:MAG: SPOR domain-containing protein [Bacteroidaceae bacterium]|nr:SPOR domain-containing protein [Bacteroidaceae bacterium]
MKARLFLILILFAYHLAGSAQKTFVDKLETDTPGEGQVRIERDARLDSLIGKSTTKDDESIKALGFRIQIYAGNNTRDARSNAQKAAEYIKNYYPELPVYTVFKSPRWLCTVGDFLYYEDAYNLLRVLKRDTPYKGAIILRNQEIILED